VPGQSNRSKNKIAAGVKVPEQLRYLNPGTYFQALQNAREVLANLAENNPDFEKDLEQFQSFMQNSSLSKKGSE